MNRQESARPGASAVASTIDHTLLRPEASAGEVHRLCEEARHLGFAAVCVNPCWVPLAGRHLVGSSVRVCSVVAFPLGAMAPGDKRYATRRLIRDGAVEIDMVLNVGALKSGCLELVERDICAVTEPCRDAGILSKVIIEAALLSDAEKVTACALAALARADYVKTSTGFGPGGATVADVALMRRVVGRMMG